MTGERSWRTPDLLRLPAGVLDAAEAEAAASGRTLDDLLAIVLAEQLPSMVSEALRVVLTASVRRANPLDVPPAETKADGP